MLPIALQIYSVREDAQADFAGVLKKVKDMGYDGVEFAGLYGYSAKQVKALLGENGLVALSAHVPYIDMTADTDGIMSTYAEIGCKYIAIPYLTEEYRPGEEKFNEVVKNAAMLGEAANRYGMSLLYHNHDFEFEKLGGKYALDVLYEKVSPELLQTEIDTCWVKVAGEDPAEYLKKYAGRAPVVHLKDFNKTGDSDNMYELIGIENSSAEKKRNFEFRPLGKGMQDIPSILAASEYVAAEWYVVEQDAPSMGLSALESAKISIDYLKSL